MNYRTGSIENHIQSTKQENYLLYLLVSTRAVIGQFSGPYGPLKFEVDSVAKLFCELLPTVLNFHSK